MMLRKCPAAGLLTLLMVVMAAFPACTTSSANNRPTLATPGIGRIVGIASYHSRGPAQPASIWCAAGTAQQEPISTASGWLSATTDDNGNFTIAPVSTANYECFVKAAGGVFQRYGVQAVARTDTHVRFTLCDTNCPLVQYHGGRVLHSSTVYLIFWLPSSFTYEQFIPGGSDARFESLTSRYIRAVGGTAYYHMLTQYWDAAGVVGPNVTFGGSFIDTLPYPHAGTSSDPIYETDIQQTVQDVASSNHWAGGWNSLFIVFTGYNVEVCDSPHKSACSFPGQQDYFVGAHGTTSATTGNGPFIYAYITDHGRQITSPPNGDPVADALMWLVSHEQFEAVTDPDGTSWYETAPARGEIGDLCIFANGSSVVDRHNIALNNGQVYALQPEWSNASTNCATGL